MDCFPVVCGNHLDRIPWTSVEEGSVGSFTDTLLTSDTEIRIDFDTAEGWMIFVRNPEHARFDRAVFDACRRTRASGAAIGGNGEDARPLFAGRFAVTRRHWPLFFYDIEHFVCIAPFPRFGRS